MKQFELNGPLFEEVQDGDTGGDDKEKLSAKDEKAETGNDEEGAEGEDEGKEDDEEVSAEELKQAKSLYKLLKDPNTAGLVIKQLAEKEGLLNKVETKADVKAARKDLKEIIKEKLGKDFAFLADKLGEVFESVLEEERINNKAELSRIEASTLEDKTQGILDKFARETKGESRKHENRMIELMDKFVMGNNVTLEDYLRGLYAQATAGRQSATVKGQMADRITRNSKDAVSRLQSGSSGNDKQGAPKGKMSLNDSVNKALEQIAKDK